MRKKVRWGEHNDPRKDSEPARHLHAHIEHEFKWTILMTAPSSNRIRKNLEAGLIALKRLCLNEQLDSSVLTLF